MPRVTQYVEISAPPRVVFNYLWDVSNLPSYFPTSNVEILEQSETRARVRHDLRFTDETAQVVCVRDALAANTHIAFRAIEGMDIEGTWTLQASQGGTRILFDLDYSPRGGFVKKLLGGSKLAKEMEAFCSESLAKLKEAFEPQARAA
jgi:ribosome-associated toxin RatA of RatAB toxin-antitoxin module